MDTPIYIERTWYRENKLQTFLGAAAVLFLLATPCGSSEWREAAVLWKGMALIWLIHLHGEKVRFDTAEFDRHMATLSDSKPRKACLLKNGKIVQEFHPDISEEEAIQVMNRDIPGIEEKEDRASAWEIRISIHYNRYRQKFDTTPTP